MWRCSPPGRMLGMPCMWWRGRCGRSWWRGVGCRFAEAPLVRFNGVRMDGAEFRHPFLDRVVLGVNADYVTADQGTGAVHTAPAHGVDDFYTGKKYGLPELQYVDNAGRQRNVPMDPDGVPYPFTDQTVFESNKAITEVLRACGALLSATEFEHSYPHCWRCHNPVIVRATEQWFIGMETAMAAGDAAVTADEVMAADGADLTLEEAERARDVRTNPVPRDVEAGGNNADPNAMAEPEAGETTFRARALEEIKTVVWDPSWGEERISNMIATRPDWCISRQRIWGVPIAVFLCNRCHEPVRDEAVNRSVVELFRRESADAWYVRTAEELLPVGIACAGCGNADRAEFRKEMDILDVWFESGAKLACGARCGAGTGVSGRPVYGGRGPASGVVSLFPADQRGAARGGAVPDGGDLRLDVGRAGACVFEVAGERGGPGGCGEAAGRGDCAVVGGFGGFSRGCGGE